MMERGRCDGCKFWEAPPLPYLQEGMGECRRHSPIVCRYVLVDQGIQGPPWPPTRADEWCGDFEMIWPPKGEASA
jgi:hypothetical protein